MDLQELTHSYDMTGKTVVVTGGAGVLGGEMACALVGCNANVVILDRDVGLAEKVIHRIEMMEGLSARAVVVYGDVLLPDTLRQADETIRREFGSIDGLVNGAGGHHRCRPLLL